MTPERTILTVDIGNSSVKACVFSGEEMVQGVAGKLNAEAVESLLNWHTVDGVVISQVGEDTGNIVKGLPAEVSCPVLLLDADTPLPIRVDYGSRATLGADRVAAACGVAAEGEDILLVDAGSAITIDFLEGLSFKGGNISAGVGMRLAALHDFTAALPLVSTDGPVPLFGTDTRTALRSGAIRGAAWEIAGVFESLSKSRPSLRLVVTGGDGPLLIPFLKECGLAPVSDPSALGRGLVRIFNHVFPLQ